MATRKTKPEPLESETLDAPKRAASVRTCISMPACIALVADQRRKAAGFTSDSDYFADLVRRDATEGIIGPKMPRQLWEKLLRAAA